MTSRGPQLPSPFVQELIGTVCSPWKGHTTPSLTFALPLILSHATKSIQYIWPDRFFVF